MLRVERCKQPTIGLIKAPLIFSLYVSWITSGLEDRYKQYNQTNNGTVCREIVKRIVSEK